MAESIDPKDPGPFGTGQNFDFADTVGGKAQIEETMAPQDNHQPFPTEKTPPNDTSLQPPSLDAQNTKGKLDSEGESSESSTGEEEKPYRFWDERKKLAIMFSRVYLVIMVIFIGILSFYWGSLYHREYRVRNMKMLVVMEDANVQLTNSSMVLAPLGEQFNRLITNSWEYGDFEYANMEQFRQTAESKNRTVFEEISEQVHHQKYWVVFYVNSTASQTVYELLVSGNSLSVPAFQLQYLITAVYESGRQYSALSQYVTKHLRLMEIGWLSNYAPVAYSNMVQYFLTSEQRQTLTQSSNSTQVPSAMSVLPLFNMVDQRPSLSAVSLGPSELGLVYAQIFAFHQFNFSVDLHNSIANKLRFADYARYRVTFSQINHLVLGLIYALMTIALKVPVDPAYGKPGFLVLWVTMYLFTSASGGVNECVVSFILYKDWKALMPIFMIFYLVLNISPTFAPFELCPGFYRYGYAIPMYNAYEALKVLFFNTWKGLLGRNYGILVAWIVVTNIALVRILKYTSERTKKKLNEKN